MAAVVKGLGRLKFRRKIWRGPVGPAKARAALRFS